MAAIYADEDVPSDQQDFIPLNVELAAQWPTISRKIDALPDADDWGDPDDGKWVEVKDKRPLLKR